MNDFVEGTVRSVRWPGEATQAGLQLRVETHSGQRQDFRLLGREFSGMIEPGDRVRLHTLPTTSTEPTSVTEILNLSTNSRVSALRRRPFQRVFSNLGGILLTAIPPVLAGITLALLQARSSPTPLLHGLTSGAITIPLAALVGLLVSMALVLSFRQFRAPHTPERKLLTHSRLAVALSACTVLLCVGGGYFAAVTIESI